MAEGAFFTAGWVAPCTWGGGKPGGGMFPAQACGPHLPPPHLAHACHSQPAPTCAHLPYICLAGGGREVVGTQIQLTAPPLPPQLTPHHLWAGMDGVYD